MVSAIVRAVPSGSIAPFTLMLTIVPPLFELEFDVLSKQADRLTKGTSGSTGSNNLTGFNPNQGGTVVNISVNGAIDPEGTARTIADTMNNSFYRGTGGALNFAGLQA
jgi:hypothetical protein